MNITTLLYNHFAIKITNHINVYNVLPLTFKYLINRRSMLALGFMICLLLYILYMCADDGVIINATAVLLSLYTTV